jgi:hypothetical protein
MVPVRLGSRYGSSRTWARLKTKNRISSGGDEPVCFGSSQKAEARPPLTRAIEEVTSSGVANPSPKGDRADKTHSPRDDRADSSPSRDASDNRRARRPNAPARFEAV